MAEDEPLTEVPKLTKALARACAALLVSWRLLICRAAGHLLGRERAFGAASESIGRIPGLRGVYMRQAFYRQTLAACGSDVYFGWQTVFSKTAARVGDGVYFGRRCTVGLAEIGAHTMLSDGVQVLSGSRQHEFTPGDSRPYKDRPQQYSTVRIGTNAWIGTNAVVMADVGSSAVVAAGAVVTEPVPDLTLAAGIPATVKRSLR